VTQVDGGGGNRRLAGILAADVVGYSAMVGMDEPGTLARVRTLRAEVIEPFASTHDGRLFKTTGDGFLIAFASAVQALRCAIAIQERLNSEPDGVPLRIGVHQGEVVTEGDDLVGDGVIIAARLEPLAGSGGICISARVREDAAGKVALEVDDLGTPELKNIAARVHVFRVRLGMPKRPVLPLPDKPSIAVLAFNNMSSDLEQEYFSDGIANDIITELSRLRWLFVIARNSSFAYKGNAVDLKRVGRELGVRYVLEGSVRRGGERVRVNAQLIDAETGNHIWAERYDRGLIDVFAVQDEITLAVTKAIGPAVADAEQRRALRKPPESLGAWEAYQRGLWHARNATAADNEQALQLFRRSIQLDPTFASPHAMLARHYGWGFASGSLLPVHEISKLAEQEARRALELDPNDAVALSALAWVSFCEGDHRGAWELAERAISAAPNDPVALHAKARLLQHSGRPDEAVTGYKTALRLSPVDPSNWIILQGLISGNYFARDYGAALEGAHHSIRIYPGVTSPYRWLAAVLGQLGQSDAAQAALRKAIEVSPASFAFYTESRPPWYRPEDHEHMLDGLRKAGWQG
jgi:adenylate cyclase